jgi:hypothetical protein
MRHKSRVSRWVTIDKESVPLSSRSSRFSGRRRTSHSRHQSLCDTSNSDNMNRRGLTRLYQCRRPSQSHNGLRHTGSRLLNSPPSFLDQFSVPLPGLLQGSLGGFHSRRIRFRLTQGANVPPDCHQFQYNAARDMGELGARLPRDGDVAMATVTSRECGGRM